MAAAEPLPDFTRWGEVERQPMKAVRRKTAQHVALAWTTIPHVTQHDVADITGLEELRKRHGAQAETGGRKSHHHRDCRQGRGGGAESVSAVQRLDRYGRRAS